MPYPFIDDDISPALDRASGAERPEAAKPMQQRMSEAATGLNHDGAIVGSSMPFRDRRKREVMASRSMRPDSGTPPHKEARNQMFQRALDMTRGPDGIAPLPGPEVSQFLNKTEERYTRLWHEGDATAMREMEHGKPDITRMN